MIMEETTNSMTSPRTTGSEATSRAADIIRKGNLIYVDFRPKTTQKPETTPAPEHKEAATTKPDMGHVRRYVEERLVDAGYHPTDTIFWTSAKYAPAQRSNKPLTLDKQIDWALARTSRFYRGVGQMRKAA